MRISLFRKTVLFAALALAPVAANAQAPTDESSATDQAADKASQQADQAREAGKAADKASDSAGKAGDSAGDAVDKASEKAGVPPTQEADSPTGGEKPTTDDTVKDMR